MPLTRRSFLQGLTGSLAALAVPLSIFNKLPLSSLYDNSLHFKDNTGIMSIKDGAITSITVTNGGAGYEHPPEVSITPNPQDWLNQFNQITENA